MCACVCVYICIYRKFTFLAFTLKYKKKSYIISYPKIITNDNALFANLKFYYAGNTTCTKYHSVKKQFKFFI